MLVTNSPAQSGWSLGSYYAEQGQTNVICGEWYQVVVDRDYYGRPIWVWERLCRIEEWHSWYGTRYGYFWECDGYGCDWVYRSDTRYWWYYTWYYYKERG